MPSTRYPERKALGARGLRYRRRLGPGLAILGSLIIPAAATAEGLPPLIRATPPFSHIGDADSPSRRQLAQTHGELETQADQLFNQLLKDPKNVDLTLRYAEAAAKLGNYEAAISSLERLLLLDRNFPGVRLQLAELYRRLNSFEMARSYLTQAEQEPGTGEQARARIQELRADIDRAASGSRFAFNLATGLRYQTHASAQPAGAEIVAGGIPQTLSSITTNRSRWDIFGTGNVQHVYDLGDVKLESNGIVYYSKQVGSQAIDVAAIEVNSGPRFDVTIDGDRLFGARPYAVANNVLLNANQYLTGVGGGLALDRVIAPGLFGVAYYEFRAQYFTNNPVVPAASAQNGNVHSVGAGLNYQLLDNGILSLLASYALTSTDERLGSSYGLVLRAGYTHTFDLPPDLGVGPLVVSPVLYRIYSKDTVLNPEAVPPVLGSTQEWRYGATAKLGITNNTAAAFNVIREITLSHVASSRRHNTQAIVSLIFAY